MTNKKTHNHPIALVLLILVGMSILVSQTAHSYIQSSIKVEATISDDATNSESQEPVETVTASQDVFLSVSTIHIDQELHQIKEIVFGDDKKEKHTHIVTKYVSSFFKTLFQQVISPNAP